ncbi:hypothetical protein BGZ79_003021 [Entomortierella chlamydospora]|nr:hypothetical protein BGZ79_003021 [Entomortierella chlamydospora]
MDRVDLAHGLFFAMHRPLLGVTNTPVEAQSSFYDHEGKFECTVDELNGYFSSLRPFTPPNPTTYGSDFNSERAVQDFFRQIDQQSVQIPRESIMDELEDTNMMYMTSVLRKRKIKMRKHKYKKLRKRTRALRKKLGK